MKNIILLIIAILLQDTLVIGQVSINTDSSSPDSSAMLDIKSTSKGVLFPRLSGSQIAAISNPANGLIVFCTTDNKFYAFTSNSNNWKEIQFGAGIILPLNFSCGNMLTDERDGQTYPTVQIGSQCWFSKNLNIGTRIDGTQSPLNNGVVEKYCYDDLDTRCNEYGGLYHWEEMMDYTSSSNSNPSGRQGICPGGWHLPSDDEWCQLAYYLDSTATCLLSGMQGTDVGGKLKESGYSHWVFPNTGATNSSGFTALPGGYYACNYPPCGFINLLYYTVFYTSTERSPSEVWFRTIGCCETTINREVCIKGTMALSVRCIKD
jgi:uncharacterized protein (TIGR02145 family)